MSEHLNPQNQNETEDEQIESLTSMDWMVELLTEKEVEGFSRQVFWPALNSLYRHHHHQNFLAYKSLGENFEIMEQLHTPLGESLIRIGLDADCDADTHAGKIRPTATATLWLGERMADEEEYLLTEECNLQIWRKTLYFFDSASPDCTYLNSYYCLEDPVSGEVEEPTDAQANALRYLRLDVREDLMVQDCVDIVNMFRELGVTYKLLNRLMRRYTKVAVGNGQ